MRRSLASARDDNSFNLPFLVIPRHEVPRNLLMRPLIPRSAGFGVTGI